MKKTINTLHQEIMAQGFEKQIVLSVVKLVNKRCKNVNSLRADELEKLLELLKELKAKQ